MSQFSIIVIGASAGGVEALKRFVTILPPELPAAIFIVLHVSPRGTSVLPDILTRSGPWPAIHAVDGMSIERGMIYIAPPDHHLLVHPGKVAVVKGPKENGYRPSVDPLFRSAAQHYGPAVIGVILSGALDDGTVGLQALKRRGGLAVVQDPSDALYPGMPSSAVENVDVDHVLPLEKIPALLLELAGKSEHPLVTERNDSVIDYENRVSEFDVNAVNGNDKPGAPSFFSCPDCGGVLWELQEGDISHYRCRVGHAWSGSSLLSEQTNHLEEALWTALRALEERAVLSRRMARNAHSRSYTITADKFEAEARISEEQAAVLRALLLTRHTGAVDGDQPQPRYHDPSAPQAGDFGSDSSSDSAETPRH